MATIHWHEFAQLGMILTPSAASVATMVRMQAQMSACACAQPARDILARPERAIPMSQRKR